MREELVKVTEGGYSHGAMRIGVLERRLYQSIRVLFTAAT